MNTVNRFVVQMIAGNYVSLDWDCFSGDPEVTYEPYIADARWFIDEADAIKTALELYPISPMKVIPIKVTIEESDHINIRGEVEALRLHIKVKYSYYLGVINTVDSLSTQTKEELSEIKQHEYKVGKIFLLKHKEFVQEPI